MSVSVGVERALQGRTGVGAARAHAEEDGEVVSGRKRRYARDGDRVHGASPRRFPRCALCVTMRRAHGVGQQAFIMCIKQLGKSIEHEYKRRRQTFQLRERRKS